MIKFRIRGLLDGSLRVILDMVFFRMKVNAKLRLRGLQGFRASEGFGFSG